jgi:hypothetical protein
VRVASCPVLLQARLLVPMRYDMGKMDLQLALPVSLQHVNLAVHAVAARIIIMMGS